MNTRAPAVRLSCLLLAGCAAEAAARPAGRGGESIVDTAAAAGRFGTLVEAVRTAGLAETLRGRGPFTLFAPTDEAFAKLPDGTLEHLLQDKRRLASVLTYHVVPARVTAAQVGHRASLPTVHGEDVPIRVDGGTLLVGGARVTGTDIACANGVIHAIDGVLMP